MTAAVGVRGLTKRFGAVAALREIDLEMAAGEALAVLGPNGAGKSTLLKVLAGLMSPSRGTVEIDGQRHSSNNRESARGRIGYVGHATLLYEELTALENLQFAARLYGVADPAARARVLLEEVGLERVGDRRAATFSRGMAQRLAIARALVHDPPLVLLDEPFSGLDRAAADRLAARLSGLRGAGRSLVLVTHDMRQACALAERVVVLSSGRIVHRDDGPTLLPEAVEAAYSQAVGAA